ncbi:MAG TPA: tyrosine-type recombinase/integrase [Gemmataceae bacterium]|nr:tyrosine-type recombinase/integrase [Gemmataceae bacterium]
MSTPRVLLVDDAGGVMARQRKRRARGSGSLFFHEKRGRWVGRIAVGRDPAGKAIVREFWGQTQRAVVEKMRRAAPPGPDINVAAWSARWLDSLTVRASTKRAYRLSIERHVLPMIGHRRLTEVTSADIEMMAAAMVRQMEVGSVHRILAAARGMFSAAVRAGLLVRNPVQVARRPRRVPKKVTPFTPEQLTDIMGAVVGYSAGPVLACMAATGCRVGEAIGLDLADYDRAARTLRITKTFSPPAGQGPPKSPHSIRTIRVPDVLVPMLEAAAGERNSGPLFTTATGNRQAGQTVDKNWRLVLQKLGLSHRRSHIMRHSVCTALIARGVPVGDVAKYLGDSVATICRVYLHPTGVDPVATLNELYGGHRVGKRQPA